MSDQNQASESELRACLLCGRADINQDTYGRIALNTQFSVHEFCLMFAQVLFREEFQGEEGLVLNSAELMRAIQRANQTQCFVCGEMGAAIHCAHGGCTRSFHLPCATEGECVTQFFGEHRSFCAEHRPQQANVAAPADNAECLICLDNMDSSRSYDTLVCPACTHAWFHRACIQRCALSAGSTAFRCPSCQNSSEFCSEMATLGIQIPERRPLWEYDGIAELLERHNLCDAIECLHPGGRHQAEDEGPWQLLLCNSCAAEGTHRQCSDLSNDVYIWVCSSCAAMDIDSSVDWQLGDSGSDSEEDSGPLHNAPEPEESGSGPTSQLASGPLRSSQLLELSTESSEPGSECRPSPRENMRDQDSPERHRGRRGSRRTPAPSSSRPPSRQGRSRSSREATAAARRRHHREPGRRRGRSGTRSRSPLRGRASSSRSRARRRGRWRSSREATAAARRRHRREPGRRRGRSGTRSRSPLRGRASRSCSHARRHPGSRRTAAPRAATRSSSRASRRSRTGRGSRQPRARTRSRSPLGHRGHSVRRRR